MAQLREQYLHRVHSRREAALIRFRITLELLQELAITSMDGIHPLQEMEPLSQSMLPTVQMQT